jgi:hypothetical protein
MPKYKRPFNIVSSTKHNVRVKLPEAYKFVHDRYHYVGLPWLRTDDHIREVQ